MHTGIDTNSSSFKSSSKSTKSPSKSFKSSSKHRNENAMQDNSVDIDALARMASVALNTLTRWCVAAPWLLRTPEIAQQVVSLAVVAADEGKERKPLDSGIDVGIKHAGATLLHVLLRDIARDESGGGELPSGRVAVSALLAEEDALRRVGK